MTPKNQTTIFFIRHGQTPSNEQGIQQGSQIDEPLSKSGKLQVEAVAKIADYLNLDVLLTSYLHRAEETAIIIDKGLKKPVPVFYDERLKERDFGSLSGKTEGEWDIILPNHRDLEARQVYDYRPFGGEDVSDVRKRVMSAVLDIAQNYENKNIGVVTHAGVIRLMQFHFPDLTRIYHNPNTALEKTIGNSDIYEWEISEDKIQNLKSLLL